VPPQLAGKDQAVLVVPVQVLTAACAECIFPKKKNSVNEKAIANFAKVKDFLLRKNFFKK
jgi:hypothetical protein